MEIRTLSEYQIGWLQAIFQYAYAPNNNQITVLHIGIDNDGAMVVEFVKYGQLKVEIVPIIAPVPQPIKL